MKKKMITEISIGIICLIEEGIHRKEADTDISIKGQKNFRFMTTIHSGTTWQKSSLLIIWFCSLFYEEG